MYFNFLTSDISSGLNSIISLFVDIFKFVFDFLRDIEFLGTNLLSFIITIFFLGTVFPIIFSLVRSTSVNSADAVGESLKKAKSKRAGNEAKKGD